MLEWFKIKNTIKQSPWVLLGENEVLISFLFLSLSSRDVNSSSELAESSSLEGAESVRFGKASDVKCLLAGRERREEGGGKNGDGELSSCSHGPALFLLAFGRDLGFEWRVLQVLLTTILSSSSLSLTNTGESHWDNGLLNGGWAAGVLLFLGTVENEEKTKNCYSSMLPSLINIKVCEVLLSLNLITFKRCFCLDKVIVWRVIIHNEVFEA